MADNVTLPGTGAVVATDDVGSVHFQQVKLVDGTLGNTTAAKVDSSGGLAVGGHVAHDAADVGNPMKVGGKARTTNPTAVADADRVDATFDDLGRQVVVLSQVRDLTVHQQTSIVNSTTETTILAAGAAGVFHDLVALVISSAGSAAVTVTIKDANAGTTRLVVYLPPITAGNTSIVVPLPVPLTQATAANTWTATLSVNTVTVHFTVQAVKNV